MKSLALSITLIITFAQSTKVETSYDKDKDLTTVRLGPVKLSGEKNRYHSLEFTLSHRYPGQTSTTPKQIYFDLISVVKARRLNTDLFVVFIVDGKTVHFSSNRSAILNPVPGRLWIGERMIFTIAAADFREIVNAKTVSIKMGDVIFNFNKEAREALKEFDTAVQGPH